MMTQIDFDNRQGTFIAGSFVTVTLRVPAKSFVEVPSAALITREGKSYVAVVGDGSRVHFTPIEVAGTDGTVIRVASGLADGMQVALNLPNTIADGAKVDPAPSGPAVRTAISPAASPATPARP
jgi:membrane fusion protein (multidrug efflux system)